MTLNLRRKIILIAVIVLLLVIGANTIAIAFIFNKEYSQALQSKIMATASSLKLQLDRLLSFGIPLEQLVGFEEQCKEVVEKNEEISGALVVDTEGKIFFHSDLAMMGEFISDEEVIKLINNKQETIFLHRVNNNEDKQKNHYDAISPLLDRNESVLGAVIVQFPEEIISKKTASLFAYTFMVSAVFFLIAVFLILILLTKWLTKPIGELLSVISQVREGDLSKKAKVVSKDEIGQVATAFNEMTDKLQASYKGLEEKVIERTKEVEEAKNKVEMINQELSQKLEELEKMNKLMIGRELKMVEMKKEIEELKNKFGQEQRSSCSKI